MAMRDEEEGEGDGSEKKDLQQLSLHRSVHLRLLYLSDDI